MVRMVKLYILSARPGVAGPGQADKNQALAVWALMSLSAFW
jgi:hypothetical protein